MTGSRTIRAILTVGFVAALGAQGASCSGSEFASCESTYTCSPASAGNAGSGGNGGSGGTAGISGSSAGGDGAGNGGEAGSGGNDTAGSSGASGTAGAGATGGTAGAGTAGTGGSAVCGNGAVESGEACDDGNLRNTDGCSASCLIEPGFQCAGTRSACNRSCNGLDKTCGAADSSDCCASSLVEGTTAATNPPFYRGYDGVANNDTSYPAIVGDFRLDNYEITVGRFRKFVAVYAPDMIANGAGKNPNNASDPGWQTAWNAGLPSDAAALDTAITGTTYHTWSSVQGTVAAESLPIVKISWYEAEAFCIWDGGRLPTEAEWNYAAAGGTQQRVYPWGSGAPDCSHANYVDTGNVPCVGSGVASRVGSTSPFGDGVWGQSDLAGNAFEWVQDYYATPYPTTQCDNCANLISATSRTLRGGSFTLTALALHTPYRFPSVPTTRNIAFGARCARAP